MREEIKDVLIELSPDLIDFSKILVMVPLSICLCDNPIDMKPKPSY